MQNWKIKRMSRKRINLWLKGIGFLLHHYIDHKKPYYCPLCDVTLCDGCLWEIIEAKQCFDLKRELGLEGDMIIVRNYKRWQTARIPMLRRWKKILKAELARRKS